MDKLEIKATLAVDDEGMITGTAWIFAEPDSVGDIIRKGAIKIAVDDLPMLFGHDPQDLVGTWIEAKETDEGFVLKGKFHLENARARAVLALVKGGLISGLSFGFRTKASTKQGRNRVITALEVFETSLVRSPAHPRARVSAKSQNMALAIADIINRATAAQLERK
jgi:HK97 family phage prohead protease